MFYERCELSDVLLQTSRAGFVAFTVRLQSPGNQRRELAVAQSRSGSNIPQSLT
jgi:hypothetical protein